MYFDKQLLTPLFSYFTEQTDARTLSAEEDYFSVPLIKRNSKYFAIFVRWCAASYLAKTKIL